MGGNELVHEAVLQRLLGGEPVVILVVAVDLLDGVSGLLGGQLAHGLLHVHDQFGVDANIGGGAADAAGRLMHQHTRMRGQETLALVPELSRNWPMEAHMPKPTVATSGSMSCMVS